MLVYLWDDVFRVLYEIILIFITRSAWGWCWEEDSGRRPLRVWTTPPRECDNHPVIRRQLYGHGVSWRLWWTRCRQGNMSYKYLLNEVLIFTCLCLKQSTKFYFVHVHEDSFSFNSEWHCKVCFIHSDICMLSCIEDACSVSVGHWSVQAVETLYILL